MADDNEDNNFSVEWGCGVFLLILIFVFMFGQLMYQEIKEVGIKNIAYELWEGVGNNKSIDE